jgi:hypothetical protein
MMINFGRQKCDKEAIKILKYKELNNRNAVRVNNFSGKYWAAVGTKLSRPPRDPDY